MPFEEKSAWIMGMLEVGTYTAYLTVILGRADNASFADVFYVSAMLWAIGISIAVSIVLHAFIAGASPKDVRKKVSLQGAGRVSVSCRCDRWAGCGRIRGHVVCSGVCVARGSPHADRLFQRQVAAAEVRAGEAEVQAAEPAVSDERLAAQVWSWSGVLAGTRATPRYRRLRASSGVFGRPEKKPQPRSGRKRGRQPGTGGSGLVMAEKPDATEDHVPAACSGCGSTLDQGGSVGFERRQVRDIPCPG